MIYVVFSVGLGLYIGGTAGLLWNKNDKVSAISAGGVILGFIMSYGAVGGMG